MMLKLKSLLASATVILSFSSQAALIGVFGDQTTSASTIATNLGHTVEVITDFSDLSGYDVVWGLNGSNSNHATQLVNNQSAFDSYVSGGGTFMYHDRFVTGAESVLAGADNFTFVRNLSSNIDVLAPNDVAGTDINNATLDGGNFSTHGYVSAASIDLPFTSIFTNGVADQLVDFHYEFGLGDVYYSSIPLDYYISGAGLVAFRDPYAPNVLNYVANFDNGVAARPVSEPSTIALLGLALIGLAARRRKI